METTQHTFNHPKNQLGKGIQTDVRIPKVKIILGDEELSVDRYKIVATWKNPSNPSKPTYAFPLGMIVETLLKNGVQVSSPLEAIRIKVKSIYQKCSELKVYDNSPNNPYTLLAWWQDGQWLDVQHPQAKQLSK